VKNLFATATLLCCALPSAAQQTPAANAYRPSPINGKAVYIRVGCHACHGTVGHGGAGARLAPNTLPLPAFETWVRNGSPNWDVSRGMPAFSPTVVSDDDLADIRAFLASLPAPRTVEDIPLLNP
jgi:mono/diheme cytochrome c family protein